MNIYELINKKISFGKYRLSIDNCSEDFRSELDTQEEKDMFDIIKKISSLACHISKKGIEFHPAIVWSGRRTFAIEDLTDKDYILLNKIELSKIPTLLRARVADILWTQKKNYQAAKVAAESYLELFKTWFNDENWFETMDMIKRAIYPGC